MRHGAVLTLLVLFACQSEKPHVLGAPPVSTDRCAVARETHCKYQCIETSASPADRPKCEVACMDKPLAAWDGEIPECTARLQR